MTDGTDVEWCDVSKSYGSCAALAGFTLRAEPGVHALLGENGAGKSTALAILTGAKRPDAGFVRVGGVPVVRGGRSAELIGFAPQALAFPATVKVREVLPFVASHYPAPLEPAEVIDRVGLTALAGRQCGGLSGGETRRLGIACALIADSPVVVFDEPSAGLDLPGQHLVQELVLDLGSRGRTVVVASHDLAEIERVADRIWLVSDGSVASHGSPAGIVAGLGRTRVEFLADPGWDWRSELGAVDPGLTPESVRAEGRAERVTLTTGLPDEVGRRVLGSCTEPDLTVTRPSLGEAIGALLRRDGVEGR